MPDQLRAIINNGNQPVPHQNALFLNNELRSRNGTFQLLFQSSDGNLVLSIDDPASNPNSGKINRPIWSARTQNNSAGLAIMQEDGNFVVYDSFQNHFFDTRTNGNPGAFIILQNDGNLVVYSADGSRALWQSGTSAAEARGVNANP